MGKTFGVIESAARRAARHTIGVAQPVKIIRLYAGIIGTICVTYGIVGTFVL